DTRPMRAAGSTRRSIRNVGKDRRRGQKSNDDVAHLSSFAFVRSCRQLPEPGAQLLGAQSSTASNEYAAAAPIRHSANIDRTSFQFGTLLLARCRARRPGRQNMWM